MLKLVKSVYDVPFFVPLPQVKIDSFPRSQLLLAYGYTLYRFIRTMLHYRSRSYPSLSQIRLLPRLVQIRQFPRSLDVVLAFAPSSGTLLSASQTTRSLLFDARNVSANEVETSNSSPFLVDNFSIATLDFFFSTALSSSYSNLKNLKHS